MTHEQTNLLCSRKLLSQEHEIPYQILFQGLQTSNILQLGEILMCIRNESDVRLKSPALFVPSLPVLPVNSNTCGPIDSHIHSEIIRKIRKYYFQCCRVCDLLFRIANDIRFLSDTEPHLSIQRSIYQLRTQHKCLAMSKHKSVSAADGLAL